VSRGRQRHGPVVSEQAGSGPPLLLLHGLGGSARWWSRNMAELGTAHDVHALDLPAFGESHRHSRFRLDRIPAQIVATMDRLGIERASLAGHSMGGLIAARMAADWPDRVERLVLVDAAFLSLDRGWWHHGPLLVLRATQPSLMRTLAQDIGRVGPIRLTEATRQLLASDWADLLPRISAPTLVVWGELDSLCPPTVGRAIVERVAGARLVTIGRAGHNPMWEVPVAFNRVVLDFLAEAVP
jgi:pimeloyl-ACP methyl ester carboxylesterase